MTEDQFVIVPKNLPLNEANEVKALQTDATHRATILSLSPLGQGISPSFLLPCFRRQPDIHARIRLIFSVDRKALDSFFCFGLCIYDGGYP